jgi:tRNA(fMet)-specific endonuclease VapC
MATKMVIFDTTVLIELYRGNVLVKQKIEELAPDTIYISGITFAEFMVGAKDKQDFVQIQKQLSNYTMLPINEGINGIFIELFTSFSLSYRPGIADTLIAATALYYDLPIYTQNRKHFGFIPGIRLI